MNSFVYLNLIKSDVAPFYHLSVFAKVKTSQAELVGKALHSAVDTETDRGLEKTICFDDDVENSNICRIDE